MTDQSALPSGDVEATRVLGTLESNHVERLRAGRHDDPFSVLGPHEIEHNGVHGLVIRALAPGSVRAWVLIDGRSLPMTPLHSDGLFEAFLPNQGSTPYRLRFETDEGNVYEALDPYAFPSTLSDFDLHLLGEGTHYENYERLGAHLREWEGVRGVSFAVWAPNASRVSVVGDFNCWDGRRHPMRRHPGVGVWDLFVPELGEGTRYKFEIIGPDGTLLPLKSDPYGLFAENRPATASIVFDIHHYRWNDGDWMSNRARRHALDAPLTIYEVHLGSWQRDPVQPERMLSYREIAERLVDHVVRLGFTHIELMPVTEHPFDGSWGYQTLGYFAPTSRHGTPSDFMALIDHCHQRGVGVIMDWVPAHFPRDDHGLRLFDGTALYEHLDPRRGEHPDWGTLVFNYGRNEVANFLLGNALFWFEKYHIDGIRVDAVASMLYLDYGRKEGEWLPNPFGGKENLDAIDFLKRLNELVHARHEGVLTIAEESTSWPGVSRPTYLGGLGFSLKWNMGWMNDTLRYFHLDPIYRKYRQNELTFSAVYAFSENFLLPLSHDEVVHGKGALLDKMPGDLHSHFANLRLLLGYMFTHPGKKLLFMGGEFGQWREWRFDESLDWHLLEHETHQGVLRYVTDLAHLVRSEKALHEVDFDWHGFEWVDFHDHESGVIAYLRRGRNHEDFLLVVCHMTPVTRKNYRVGVPCDGFYREINNSDSALYNGSNVGNGGGVEAEPVSWHGRSHSLLLTIPPLSVLILKLQRLTGEP